MVTRKIWAAICYGWVGLAALAFGIRYLLAGQVMPYHLEALGTTWQGLSPGAQVMTLNFMKSAAAGFVTCAVAIGFLLAFPFRQGELWSRWALLTVSVCELSIITYCTNQVKVLTPADPPLTAALVLIGISVLGFFLFPGPGLKKRRTPGV